MRWHWSPLQWVMVLIEGALLIVTMGFCVQLVSSQWTSFTSARSLVRQYTSHQGSLSTVRAEFDSLQALVHKMESARPVGRDQTILLQQIHDLAETASLQTISSLKPLVTLQRDNMHVARVQLNVSGEYTQLMQFISYLERADPPFLIRTCRIETDPRGRQSALQAELTLEQAGETASL